MTDFGKGDIVQLVSGGPNMTVESVTSIPGDTSSMWIRCQWFVEGRLFNETFHSKSLKRVQTEGEAKDEYGPDREQD